jgi:hypothetical protein
MWGKKLIHRELLQKSNLAQSALHSAKIQKAMTRLGKGNDAQYQSGNSLPYHF